MKHHETSYLYHVLFYLMSFIFLVELHFFISAFSPPLPSPPRDQARAAAAAVAALERGRRRDRGRHHGRFRAPSPGRNRSPDSRLLSPERFGMGQPPFFPPHPHMWSYGPQPFPMPPGVALPSSSRSLATSSSTPIEHPLKARYIGSDVTGHAAFGSVRNKLNGEFFSYYFPYLFLLLIRVLKKILKPACLAWFGNQQDLLQRAPSVFCPEQRSSTLSLLGLKCLLFSCLELLLLFCRAPETDSGYAR